MNLDAVDGFGFMELIGWTCVPSSRSVSKGIMPGKTGALGSELSLSSVEFLQHARNFKFTVSF